MNHLVGGLFSGADKIQMLALDQRMKRSEVINSNIANAETPGFRALGYDFEKQLQAASELDRSALRVSHPKHLKSRHVSATGELKPDVYIRPTESVGEDGNTVDVDKEMAQMAQNQIMYQSAVELINRKVGILRYAINGGR